MLITGGNNTIGGNKGGYMKDNQIINTWTDLDFIVGPYYHLADSLKHIPIIYYEEIKPTDIVLTEWENELPPRELTNINGKLYWIYEL